MFEVSLKKFRFFNFLLAALILTAVLLLARNIVNFSLSLKEFHKTVQEDKFSGSVQKKDIMDYSDILEKNPFGPPLKLHPIAVTQEPEIRQGSLSDLILVGTAFGPGGMGYAIFEDKATSPGKQEVFAHGENVFNQGTLTKIEKSSVEIERNAVTYTLTIPVDEVNTDAEEPQAHVSGSSQKSFARKIGEKQYLLDRRKVQQSLENPEQILTNARLLPNFINGRQEGFTISEVVPDGLYHSLGLRNGDILLKINGLEMSNPEVAIQALSALRGMNRVNLDIVREGKNMSMSYQIR